MKKMIKRILFLLLGIYVIIMAYPIGYFVLDQKQDVSCFEKDPNKKYEGIGAYVINLDRSPERFDYVIDNLKGLNVPVHRISAVDGKKLTEKELHEKADYALYQ